MSTLEQRIASALSEEIASTDVATLISETEAAIVAADTAAEAERQKALDPVLSPDPAAARAAMEQASFARDRLRTVLPKLQRRLQQLEAAEYAAGWVLDFTRAPPTREESLRVIANLNECDRQREEREAAEARAENARQIERRRRQGWPI